MSALMNSLADALEAAADVAEARCVCEYHHAPECPVAAWRALVREARAVAAERERVLGESEAA